MFVFLPLKKKKPNNVQDDLNRTSLLYVCSSMACPHEKPFSKAHKTLNEHSFVMLKGHESKICRVL